jgi:hypothetical protein
MLKQLTGAVGMVVLASSFAFAGQNPPAPSGQPGVEQSQRAEPGRAPHAGKRHHKKHHRHHKHHRQVNKR